MAIAYDMGKATAKIDAREVLEQRRREPDSIPESTGPNPWRHEALEAFGVSVDCGEIDPDQDDSAKERFVDGYVEYMIQTVGER